MSIDTITAAQPDISVVIPVYNGTKFLKKTVQGILRQTLRNIEVILVENGSSDGSFELCQKLAAEDPRVKVLHNEAKGTSLARKMGIEHASGKYIVFSDQDDAYINNHALQGMYNAIAKDDVQICQFGHYQEYLFGLKRKIEKAKSTMMIERNNAYADQVKGVAGVHGNCFDTAVWNKIYHADVLKNAAKNVTVSLCFAEDENLNLWAFFDSSVERVSVRNEAFYVWNVGTGFSSSKKSGETLFRDYEVVKPTACRLLAENGCSDDTLFQCYLENIYFFKVIIDGMIADKEDPDSIRLKIQEMDSYHYVTETKAFFRQQPQEKLWDELKFLISDYSAEEYLDWCTNHAPKKTMKRTIRKTLSLIK